MTENHVEMTGHEKKLSSYEKFRIFIYLSIGFFLLSWLFDSILDSVIFHERTLFEQIFNPSDQEIAVRLLFAIILILFSAYAQISINRLKNAHESLQMAIEKTEIEKNKSNAIISALGDGIIIQDTDYKIIYQNQIQTDIYGNHIGEYCFKAYEDLDNICEDCPVEITFRDGKIHRTVRQVPTENGLLYIELTSSPLRDSSGNIIAGVKVVRNITEQKLMEEKRRLSELKYRTLFETMSQGVVYQDVRGRITSANPAAERILGLTVDQMQGRTSTDPRWKAIHEDGSDFHGEMHPSMVALRSGKEVRDEVMGVFNPAENEYKWINVHAVPQFKPGENKPFQVYTTFENITRRKNAEKAMQESEARYRALFDNSPISIWEEDISEVKKYIDSLRSKGIRNFETYFESHAEEVLRCAALVKVLNVNKATISLFEAKDKEDFYKGISEVFTQHSHDVFQEELIDISQGKTTFEGEDILKSFTGKLIPVFLRWSIAPGHEETYANRLVSIVDITERKQMEEILKKTNRQQKAILNNIPDLAWLKDKESRFIAVNEPFAQICGVTSGDIEGKNDLDIWPEDLAERYRADDIDVMSSRKRKRVEEPLVDKDGKKTWIETIKTPIYGDNGEIIGTTGIARDITDRKLIEEKLNLFSYAVEEAADGIQIVDMGGYIVYSNRAVEEMYGFSREELRGKDVNEMNLDKEFAGKVIIPFVQKTGRWSGELLVNHKDGNAFPIWLTASVVKDNKGMPIAMIGIIKDITERKRAEDAIKKYTQAIEESNRMKELFIDIMHHDLLNPLSTARGFIELLNEGETEEKKKKYLEVIERNLVKSMELIDNATKLSKLESSKTIKFEKLDLSEVVEEVIKNFTPLATKAGMNIENKIARDMPVKANKIIEEVFANFISNAIKYASSGKKIVINGEESEDRWKIQVIDWGESISDNDKGWIFERFSRKEKKGVKGSGLGLAIAKKIVELHKGRIWVEDNPEGGAVFIVEIPKEQSQLSRDNFS